MPSLERVLFLCTGNSARSQMAEGLLRHLAGDRYEVHSAGTEPRGVHPRTIEVMEEIGVDLGRHSSKRVDRFLGERFDHVITVCDRAREHCPVFPGARVVHWSFDDPAIAPRDNQLSEFRRVRDEILGRLRLFVAENTKN